MTSQKPNKNPFLLRDFKLMLAAMFESTADFRVRMSFRLHHVYFSIYFSNNA